MKNKQPVSQKDKFIAVAREHGCDESEEAFDAKLGKLAKAPLPPEKPKAKK
jgi:hypothetical protein